MSNVRVSAIGKIGRVVCLTLLMSLAACSSPEERARAHYESGQKLLEEGDAVRASLEFRNAIKYDEKLAPAWLALGNIEEKNQNFGAAVAAFKRVTELDPKAIEAQTKMGKYLLAGGSVDEALRHVNAAYELKKDDTAILALRAAVLLRLNDREGARVDAEKALALNPDNADAHAILAADQLMGDNGGNRVAALRFIERGLSADPSNLGLLLLKIKVYDDAKDDANLEGTLRQAIAAHQKLKELRQALLQFLGSRGRLAEVETEMRAMLVAEPDNTALGMDLVRFLGSRSGADAARGELQRMIAAHPQSLDYRLALVELDISEKKIDDAVSALNAIIAKGEPKADVARARIVLASVRLNQRDIEATKAEVEKILAEDAKNADGLALRAQLRLEAGDGEGAIADLREALNQTPQSIKVLTLLARAQESQGAIELAAEHYGEAAKLSNHSPALVLEYVAFLDRRGKRDQVERVLAEGIARNPRDRSLLSALARVKLAKQDWIGAQETAEALKKLGNDTGIGDQILAASLSGQKKFDESIGILKTSQAADPESTQSLRNLVVAYLQAGKPEEADAFLQSVLAANDKNAVALVLRGLVMDAQKRGGEAETYYKLAIERQPDNAVGYVALANYFIARKKFTEAEDILKEGRSKAPPDIDLSLALASLLEQRHDIEGAIAVYEEQMKTSPQALVLVNNLASLLSDFRTDPESFERAHDIAAKLAGIDVPQFKDTLGWIAYRRGEYQTALDYLTDAALKIPKDPHVQYHLGMTYLALKRSKEALDHFRAADALLPEGDPLRDLIKVGVASAGSAQ